MRFQDVVFLPSKASFTSHLLIIIVVFEASGPPHVLKLWLGLSKGMLPVKYFDSLSLFLCCSNLLEIVGLLSRKR